MRPDNDTQSSLHGQVPPRVSPHPIAAQVRANVAVPIGRVKRSYRPYAQFKVRKPEPWQRASDREH